MKKLGLVLLLICTIAFYYHYKKGDLPFELPFQERNSSTSEEYSQNEEPGISTKAYVGNIRNHKLRGLSGRLESPLLLPALSIYLCIDLEGSLCQKKIQTMCQIHFLN